MALGATLVSCELFVLVPVSALAVTTDSKQAKDDRSAIGLELFNMVTPETSIISLYYLGYVA